MTITNVNFVFETNQNAPGDGVNWLFLIALKHNPFFAFWNTTGVKPAECNVINMPKNHSHKHLLFHYTNLASYIIEYQLHVGTLI